MSKVNVVAEFGQTMRGDVGLAVDMVQMFGGAGATHIKVQMLHPDTIASGDAESYWHTGPPVGQRQAFLQNGVVPHTSWEPVREMCDHMAVGFIATPFDFDAVDALVDLDPAAVKIASGDITHLPLIERIGKLHANRRILLSCGASSGDEIITAMRTLNDAGVRKDLIVPMACTLRYPAIEPLLHRVHDLRRNLRSWDGEVGYSDHTESTATGMFAALAGATWIEKHVTPNPTGAALYAEGEVADDRMGLDVEKFAAYADGCRAAMPILSDAGTSGDELAARHGARRAARYAYDLLAGALVTYDSFTWLRPDPGGDGGTILTARFAVEQGLRLRVGVRGGDLVAPEHFAR